MDSDNNFYFSYYRLDNYRSEKININLIKNYKNYNFKSRNGISFK